MANKWIEALKIYNKNKGMWCLPKKGTEEHKEVVEIMNNMNTQTKPKTQIKNKLKKKLKKTSLDETNILKMVEYLKKSSDRIQKQKKNKNYPISFSNYSLVIRQKLKDILEEVEDYNLKMDIIELIKKYVLNDKNKYAGFLS